MKINEIKVKIADLTRNYSDNGDGGVFGLDGKLTIRPNYQREFVYSDKKRDMVIDTVRKGFPLGLMYWNKTSDNTYEVLDGQQRTISISQYLNVLIFLIASGSSVLSVLIDGEYCIKFLFFFINNRKCRNCNVIL